MVLELVNKFMTNWDDSANDAYQDRKDAEVIKYQAEQAQRKGYSKTAKILWDAYSALLEEAVMEEVKAAEGV